MSFYTFNAFAIPDRMGEPLLRWISEGKRPGDFLCAVLRNDLKNAIALADDENVRNLPAYTGYLYNEAPSGCWGDAHKFEAWGAMHESARQAEAA